MKCFECGTKMCKRERIDVTTSWGDGPEIEVVVPGWECECCGRQVFDGDTVRILQDAAISVVKDIAETNSPF